MVWKTTVETRDKEGRSERDSRTVLLDDRHPSGVDELGWNTFSRLA